jgi:hypothetical protein
MPVVLDLKDAMVAVVGGAIALGGLLLIFVGFLVGQAAALQAAATPAKKETTDKYRQAGKWGLLPFVASLLIAVAATLYWFFPCEGLAKSVLIAFIICALGSVAYGVKAALML